jgi:hypothetical protein
MDIFVCSTCSILFLPFLLCLLDCKGTYYLRIKCKKNLITEKLLVLLLRHVELFLWLWKIFSMAMP